VQVSPDGSGTVEISEDLPSSYPTIITFSSGDSVHLRAVPVTGYAFDGWSGDLSDGTNPTDMVINCSKNTTANFSQVIHTLTMQVSNNGSTTPEVGTYSYSEETAVDITATPDSGWHFDGWTGDVANPGLATTTVTMGSDKTLAANFSQVKPRWWLIGGITAGVIIISMTIWLAIRRRAA